MTTFAGKTIPPLFGGGADLIFLLGIGAPENYDELVATTGNNIDKPVTQAGDTLFVFSNLSDSLGTPTQNDWVALTGILNNNQGRILFRIADDTADDNFSFASGQFSNGTSIFAAFRTTPGFFLEHLSSNVQLQVTNTSWGINLLTATAPDNTLVFCLMSRSGSGIGGGFSVTNTVDIPNIIQASGENHGAANHALWRFWGWEFEATPRAHPVDDQTYAPTQNAATKTRYARFQLAVIP